jgi:hypothetical protein
MRINKEIINAAETKKKWYISHCRRDQRYSWPTESSKPQKPVSPFLPTSVKGHLVNVEIRGREGSFH